MKSRTLKISLIIILLVSVKNAVIGQEMRQKNYYQCIGGNCFNTSKKVGIYSIDTTLKTNNIETKSTYSEFIEKGKIISNWFTQNHYDTMGRTTEYTDHYRKRAPRIYIYNYDQKNKIIRTYQSGTLCQHSINIYNTNGTQTCSYFEEIKKGKLRETRLYNYELTANDKPKSLQGSIKNDTNNMQYYYKYYYKNDTGDKIKVEFFRKGKVSFTQIYDCDLTAKPIQSKDSGRVCLNKATDDRGYTYTTNFIYEKNSIFKTIYVTDASKNFVSYHKYLMKGTEETMLNSYIKYKDSIVSMDAFYTKKYRKIKSQYTTVKHLNADKTIAYQHQVNQIRKKTSQVISYFKYFENGLMKSSKSEWIDHKGKLTYLKNEIFTYSQFGF